MPARPTLTLDEKLSEAQRVLRDGYHDELANAVAEVRNRFTLRRRVPDARELLALITKAVGTCITDNARPLTFAEFQAIREVINETLDEVLALAVRARGETDEDFWRRAGAKVL